MKIKIKRREWLIYLILFLYCAALFFKRVSLPFDAENFLNNCMTLAAILSLVDIAFDFRMTLKQWVLFGLIGVLLFVDSIPTGNHELLYLFLVLWTCRNTDKRRTIKYIWIMVVIFTILTMGLVLLGVVKNESFLLDGWRERYGLGYGVWSILPFQYMSICIYALYFKKRKIKLKDLVIITLGAVPIFMLTDTKSGLAYTCVGALGLYIVDRVKNIKWEKMVWLQWLPIMASVGSYATVLFFIKGTALLEKVNIFLNYRLMYPALAFQRYSLRWLANPELYDSFGQADAYFGIDNNYLNLLFTWGIIALIIVCYIYMIIIRRCLADQDGRLLFLVLFSLFIGLTWSRMIVLIEAEFLVCFSDLFRNEKKAIFENRLKKVGIEEYLR